MRAMVLASALAASTLTAFSCVSSSQAKDGVESPTALPDNRGADVGWKGMALEYAECAAFHLDRGSKNRSAEFLEKGRLIAESTGVIKAEAVNRHFVSHQKNWRSRIDQRKVDDMEIMVRNIDCASTLGKNTPLLEQIEQESNGAPD